MLWLPQSKLPPVLRGCAKYSVSSTTPLKFAPLHTRPGGPQQPDSADALTRGSLRSFGVPPLLRSYLAMGGWVSDHLVVDRDLGTLHVFAGLEVRAVPVARALALRRLVG